MNIFKYDMAPHHQEVKTFPHHKHIHSNNVIEASIPAFAQVLNEISDYYKDKLPGCIAHNYQRE
ncbi:toxin-antitoxin system TumE family protein [Desulfobacula sp.]|uniref:toxin-antitoxin system TumE family protein n=1 Tax=Desulfobacula sp. TaxID=2593537 RepID=UPI003FA4A3CF